MTNSYNFNYCIIKMKFFYIFAVRIEKPPKTEESGPAKFRIFIQKVL